MVLQKSAPAATTVVSNGSEDFPDAAAVPPTTEDGNNSRAAVHAEQEDAFGGGGGDWRLQPHFLPTSLGRASSGNLYVSDGLRLLEVTLIDWELL